MSNVDYDTFLQWATDKFGPENLRIRNNEIKTHSPFTADVDKGFHLWMNPAGGKNERPNGAFRCWKTDRRGSLVKLVSELDHVPWDVAEEMLCGGSALRRLEAEMHGIIARADPWGTGAQAPAEEHEPGPTPVSLPPHAYRITDLSASNEHRQAAEAYLSGRKLPPDDFYVCTRGPYRNRIVIPYHDEDGDIVYWNARYFGKRDDVDKYMKPEDEDVDRTCLLFAPAWSRPGERVHITEGEFDAVSLSLAGLRAVACGGKHLHDAQIERLRGRIPVLATDNDAKARDAGLEALLDMGERLVAKGFGEVHYVRPPVGYKDWNELLQKRGPDTLRAYVERHTKPFGSWTRQALRFQHLG